MSWNLVRSHEIQFQTDSESFSFLSWKTKKFYSWKKNSAAVNIKTKKALFTDSIFQWRFWLKSSKFRNTPSGPSIFSSSVVFKHFCRLPLDWSQTRTVGTRGPEGRGGCDRPPLPSSKILAEIEDKTNPFNAPPPHFQTFLRSLRLVRQKLGHANEH